MTIPQGGGTFSLYSARGRGVFGWNLGACAFWAQGVCMKDIMSLPLWGEVDPNIYTEPTIVRFRTAPSNLKCIGPSRALYGICGPDDGEDIRRGWFRSEGMVWTWESRSGARYALKAMRLRREKRAKFLAKLAEEGGSSTK